MSFSNCTMCGQESDNTERDSLGDIYCSSCDAINDGGPYAPAESEGETDKELEIIEKLKYLDISDCIPIFTKMVRDKILETEKNIDDLTLGEMRDIIIAVKTEF